MFNTMEIWTLIKSQSNTILIVLVFVTLGYLHFDRKENVYQRYQKYTVIAMGIVILAISFWFSWQWQQIKKARLDQDSKLELKMK